MSSLSVYKPANLFIIVSKYFFPIPLLKISSVTVSADVFLYQPEFPWLNSSNIYLLTLLNADTFSFASHLSPAILHSGLNSIPLFQFRFIIFQVHKKSLIAFITHAEQTVEVKQEVPEAPVKKEYVSVEPNREQKKEPAKGKRRTEKICTAVVERVSGKGKSTGAEK